MELWLDCTTDEHSFSICKIFNGARIRQAFVPGDYDALEAFVPDYKDRQEIAEAVAQLWTDDKIEVHKAKIATLDAEISKDQKIQDEISRIAERTNNAVVRLQTIQAEAVAQAATDADDVIALAPLLPAWMPKAYAAGDVVQYGDEPYRAIMDIPQNPQWDPVSAPSEWAAYHATSEEYALPWRKPSGAHDTYKVGEWMIWTDGAAYECLQDTAYSPEEYAQAWRTQGDNEEPGDDEDTVPLWVQPTGGHDAYKIGDRVTYESAVWVSTANGNVWVPGVYGWTKE